MSKNDQGQPAPLFDRIDLPASIGLLTRLPLQIDSARALARGAKSAWAWPLVGLLPAMAAAAIAWIALALHLPTIWAAGLAIVAQIFMTGAMHEDGLADTADGFWGGYERERRLEIMKDSRIGAYGVIALIVTLALRVSALSILLETSGFIAVLAVIGVVSRIPMVLMLTALGNARSGGLSSAVGAVPRTTASIAFGIAVLVTLVAAPHAALPLFVWLSITGLALATLAKVKIGGQTGDVLGASQQIAELTALGVFASLAS